MMESLSLNNNPNYIYEIDKKLLGVLYLRHIYKRVHEYKFNFLGMITGKHRVGKSTTAISMASSLDKTFEKNLEERVVYFPNDFMRALQNIKKHNIRGGAIVWDEAGVGIPAREWYDIANKSITMTLQVFGRYLPIVYFVTPDVTYIDSQARKLFHGFYEMNRKKTEYAIVKPFDVRYNKRNAKVYYVYSRFHSRNEDVFGTTYILKQLNVMAPKAEIEDRYEIHSKIFKDKIIEQMEERTKTFEEGKVDPKRLTYDELIQTLVDNKDDKRFLSKKSCPNNIIFDVNTLRFEFDIPAGVACHIKRKAELIVNNVPEDKQIT